MFTNNIYCGDTKEVLMSFDNNSIDLTITSPPYFNLRDYCSWPTYEDYMVDVSDWFKELFRVTKIGRHVCWNVQDTIPVPQKPYGRMTHALMPDSIRAAINSGFVWENNVIWLKNNVSTLMFGSYPYPPNLIYRNEIESILILRKPGRSDLSNKTEESKISKEEWIKYADIIWNITPESAKRIGHPAPFPREIPKRLIKMHSFVNDIILDPFIGSGTTAVECISLNRRYVGIEKHESYIEIANKRIIGAASES